MQKVLRFLNNAKDLLTTAAAVFAAAIVAVETYEALRKKFESSRSPDASDDLARSRTNRR